MAGEQASLEALVETGLLELETLHPGGLETTRELTELCNIRAGDAVLDVACGTGETACFLAETFGARVHGIDYSEEMIRRARAKAEAKGLDVTFEQGDAHALPFDDGRFDAVISEATLCFLDKACVIGEMARVARPGGRVGMHDLCWQEGAPEKLRQTLGRIEAEWPETLAGWQDLFAEAGLDELRSADKSEAMARWMKDSRKQLGLIGNLVLGLRILRRWGPRGLVRILRSERVFNSPWLGYGLVTGQRN